jgi:NAD(P)-dependent dehydrogenase (short-subunit alcohol dehydrogenase family)
MSYLEELFSLNGKVAAVIGGSGVLGGAIAEGLAHAGAKVAVVGRDQDRLQKRVDAIEQIGALGQAVQCDASQRSALVQAKDQIVSTWDRIDILVNAPGVNSVTPFFEITEDEWQWILDVNLKSIFLASQVFAQQMIDQKDGGSIINISSASSGPPLSKVFTYGISKAGGNNLTQFLARELAPNKIRVNAIAPGFFPAEQNRKILTKERTSAIFNHTAMARFGEAGELVGSAIWLASEKASSFVTGAIVRVDGGFTAMTI